MSINHEDVTRRMLRILDREIRSRGRGSIQQLHEAVDRTDGWWQHRLKSGDIMLDTLFKVVDHLGLDFVKLLRRALERDDDLYFDRPRGEPPELVQRARERFAAGEEGSGVGETWVDTLDEQRLQDPQEVVSQALWGVEHAELHLLPRLLGAAGSAWGLMLCLDEAEHALYEGIRIARAQGDRRALGSLARRLSSVVGDRGHVVEAFHLAEKATLLALRAGDGDGIGRGLVAQGIWLYELSRVDEAASTFQSALDLLAPDSRRNRFSALQALSLIHQGRGDLPAALESVESAEEHLPAHDQWAKGKLLWLKGRIHGDQGELERASLALEEVVEIFRGLHLGETALATCEWTRIELLRGRAESAYRAASSMVRLIEPLQHNEVISAAIMELLRAGKEGLTLALVQRVEEKIEAERRRARHLWRALKVHET